MNFKTLYSVVWYIFRGCFILWLICGLGYRFLFNDAGKIFNPKITQIDELKNLNIPLR